MSYRVEFKDVGRDKRSFTLEHLAELDEDQLVRHARKLGGLMSRDVSLSEWTHSLPDGAVAHGHVAAGLHPVGHWIAYEEKADQVIEAAVSDAFDSWGPHPSAQNIVDKIRAALAEIRGGK